MKNKAVIRRTPAAAIFDDACRAYLDAQAEVARLSKEIYALTRSAGVALKDAPKSRLLAGVQFEALASLATRTDVDQKAACALERVLPEAAVFVARTVYELRDDWERGWLATIRGPMNRERLRARVLACLRTRPVKRLTVRKRKSSPQRAQGPQRRAA